jgi:hypothetical protein
MHLLKANKARYKSDVKSAGRRNRKRRKKGRKSARRGKRDGKKGGQYAFIRSVQGCLKCDVQIDSNMGSNATGKRAEKSTRRARKVTERKMAICIY